MSHQCVLRLLVVVSVLANCGASFAQRGLRTRSSRWRSAQNLEQKQREKAQELMQARQQLFQQERTAIAEAMKQLAAAKQTHRQAGKELKSTRENVQKGIEDSLGLTRLRDDLMAVQVDYKKIAEPVLENLKGSEDYLVAEKKAKTAKLRIQDLRSDSSIGEAETTAKLSELINESMAASNLEQLTLQKDRAVSNAHDRVEAAQSKVAEALKKAVDKAEKDSTVSTAQQAVKSAYTQVKSAEANLASIQGVAAAAEQQLQAGILPRKTDQPAKGKDDGKGGKKN